MYGKVTRYFQDRGYGFILGEDRKTYFIHHANLDGEHIERGCSVHFKPFQNERSDNNAMGVIVVDAPEKGKEKESSNSRKKKPRHRKPCNADKVILDDRKFKRFVKAFFEEQEEMKDAMEASDGKHYERRK
ncbi:cold shock domain-containing protein [Acetatifactor aquisgranensis]|uniref:cold shock domain-containing protein n=1 Tax=Acetatifactor aquisgranensis TaxID=2941233 RepID=UPI00203FB110|nr:cold shock domain-containing protein [Acetatifactor aquisgranensis]